MFTATHPTLPDPTHLTEAPHLSPPVLPAAVGIPPNAVPNPIPAGGQEFSPLTKVSCNLALELLQYGLRSHLVRGL